MTMIHKKKEFYTAHTPYIIVSARKNNFENEVLVCLNTTQKWE